MKLIIIYMLFLISCSSEQIVLKTQLNDDIIDKILFITKDRTIIGLHKQFGAPFKVSPHQHDPEIEILEYKNPLLHIYLNSKKQEVALITYFNSSKEINYSFMKNKFLAMKWEEKPSKNIDHVIQDQFIVEIKEVNISFEYDKELPTIFRLIFGPRN